MNLNEKVILVSLRKIDVQGNEEYDVFFGKVSSYNKNTVILIRQDGSEFSIPYDEECIEPAEEGFYELEDGSTFDNPDFIARFAVYRTEEAYKKHGTQ